MTGIDDGARRQADQALAVPVEPDARLDPAGFDPSRKTFAFIKDDLPDAPGKISVAIVQKCGGEYDAELVDFRLCGGREEMVAYLALYGLNFEPVWTAASGTLTEGGDSKPDAQGSTP